MRVELHHIGWVRSALLVCASALLAFVGWSASGAKLGGADTADVVIRAVAAPSKTSAPSQSARREAHWPRTGTALGTARRRTHVCIRGGRRHRVDLETSRLTFRPPSSRVLDRPPQAPRRSEADACQHHHVVVDEHRPVNLEGPRSPAATPSAPQLTGAPGYPLADRPDVSRTARDIEVDEGRLIDAQRRAPSEVGSPEGPAPPRRARSSITASRLYSAMRNTVMMNSRITRVYIA
jgi:hypothetical protein